jgi:hypothetical protein
MSDAPASAPAPRRPPESFERFYERAIAPALAPLEETRRRAVKRHYRLVGGGFAVAAGILGVAALTSGVGWWASIGAGLAVLTFLGFGLISLDAMGKAVKRVLVPRVAAYAGLRYAARVPDASSIAAFRWLGLVPTFDRAACEDFIAGERAGCVFALYEAELKRRRKDSKGRVYYSTCFRGQLLRVGVPFQFLGATVVLRDVSLPPRKELKRARLVDPKFEDVFEVYTTDQVEARYLLPPDFMERLLAFEALLHGKQAQAGFAGGEMLISMRGGDLFESDSMFTPVADLARARRVLEEFELIHAIIDALMARREGEGLSS